MKGLFYVEEHKGRCHCDESQKDIDKRSYTYYAYYCHNPCGVAKDTYDNRKLLRVTCTKCGSTWVEYRPTSKYWTVINDTPYTDGERFYSKEKKTLGTRIKEWYYGFIHKTKTEDSK